MVQLNLPPYSHQIKNCGKVPQIYDTLRKKYVQLTDEEWVRQHMIHYLVQHCGYPATLITVERALKSVGRADILIYTSSGKLYMIIECKRPQQKMNPKVLAQLGRYNTQVKAPYITLTNGIQHFAFHYDAVQKKYVVLSEIPFFERKI